jgi:hypothetical protein
VQRVVNTTIEKEVFSMWFAYIHCWATDAFSMDPRRDCISGTEQIKKVQEWNKSSAHKEEGFG